MKKSTILRSLLCLIVAAATLFPVALLPANADGTHGFYMECDASVTDNKSDGFMIDFYSDSADALATYWANVNWHMDLTEARKKYRNIEGGGAYAGLQIKYGLDQHVGIMSMWKWQYRDAGKKTDLYAETVYGTSATYHNEGSGTSCIMPYDWKNGQWYRQLLQCWIDEETGYTFVGTWFYEYETQQWTLFAYYNTFLPQSFIKGGCSQFLENFVASYNDRTRSFRYRNVYFKSHDTGEWVSSPKVKVFTDGNMNAVGTCTMGQAEDGSYVWGQVVGSQPDNNYKTQTEYYTIKQDDKPALGTPEIEGFDASDLKDVQWKMAAKSTPQLSFTVTLTDPEGKEIARKTVTRPEVQSVSFDDVTTDAYKCDLVVTDVFGAQTTASATTRAYDDAVANQGNETSEPTTEPASEPASEPATLPETKPEPAPEKKSSLPFVIVGVCAAVIVVGAVAAIVIVSRKKRR